MEHKNKPLKVVIVGDGLVGKSCLCKSYANKCVYKKPYQPTISDTHEISVIVEWKAHHIILWDTAGVEEWEHLRSKDYDNTDCFICCYAIDNRTSFQNVESKWIPELRRYSPYAPIIIVATKKDLRRPSNFHISEDEGKSLQRRLKVQGFIECSSKSIGSIEAVLMRVVSMVLDMRNKVGDGRRKFACKIL